jgi:hypothetical protein
VELAEYALNKLVDMKAENDGSHSLISNIYATARRWKDVARIGQLMKKSGIGPDAAGSRVRKALHLSLLEIIDTPSISRGLCSFRETNRSH